MRFLPFELYDGVDELLVVLLYGLDGDDRTRTTAPPSGNGGARDGQVLGQASGAGTDHVVPKTVGRTRSGSVAFAVARGSIITKASPTLAPRQETQRYWGCRSCVHVCAKGLRTQHRQLFAEPREHP